MTESPNITATVILALLIAVPFVTAFFLRDPKR